MAAQLAASQEGLSSVSKWITVGRALRGHSPQLENEVSRPGDTWNCFAPYSRGPASSIGRPGRTVVNIPTGLSGLIYVPALCPPSQWPSSKNFHQENSVRVSCPPPSIYSVAFIYKEVDTKSRLVLSWHRNVRISCGVQLLGNAVS
jgi:hypothetical protein